MKRKTKFFTYTLIILFTGVFTQAVNAQSTKGFHPGDGFKQFNFGVDVDGWGIPIYAGMDFGVSEMITIGPRVSFQTRSSDYEMFGIDYETRSSLILPSFRGDYHFSGHIEGLPEALDLYGGVSLGLALYSSTVETDDNGEVQKTSSNSSDLELWLQLGARYYFSEKWGVQLEFISFGNNGSVGVSYRL